MTCVFDEVIERKNTNSLKYDFAIERGKPADVLPLWVADMDFKAPKAVVDSLIKASRFGIYGYSESKDGYFTAIQKWYKKYHGWDIKKNWLVKTPGVVFAICMAIRALTKEGDSVLIQSPVYYPFFQSVLDNGRTLVTNQLRYHDGQYSIDFDDFEEKIKKNDVKLFILCSPHNPVGRVWTAFELTRIGEICEKYGVYVVSDEIHADFVYSGHKHYVFAKLNREFADRTITCTSPSKSFNLAGLQVSNIFIENENMKLKFQKEIDKAGYSQLNGLGLVACQAAYENGRQWLDNLKQYLVGNLEFTNQFLKQKLPQVKLVEPEGTYLLWLDFRKLGLDGEELENLIVNRAKLWLDSGTLFGSGGEGFMRINLACPQATLYKALCRLEKAIIG